MREWKATQLIWGMLLWNNWAMKRLYEDYHHTSNWNYTNKVTEARTKEYLNKYAFN
jgi:hypothetical protein